MTINQNDPVGDDLYNPDVLEYTLYTANKRIKALEALLEQSRIEKFHAQSDLKRLREHQE